MYELLIKRGLYHNLVAVPMHIVPLLPKGGQFYGLRLILPGSSKKVIDFSGKLA